MKALGHQIMVEFYNCDTSLLNSIEHIRKIMLEAACECGATVVKDVFHLFNPHGVSGVVVIAESHLAIHTWPEYGYAAVDLFTCGEDINPEIALEILQIGLKAGSVTAMEVRRGVIRDAKGELLHKPTAVG